MRPIDLFSLTGLLAVLSVANAGSDSGMMTSVSFRVAATHQLPNPYALLPSTHATLTSQGNEQAAPLSAANIFVFHNVTPDSYLVDVHCLSHVFPPIRVDVQLVAAVNDVTDHSEGFALQAWETYRGNDWENRGQVLPLQNGVFEVQALAAKNYFVERSKFSVFSILRNPMILLGLVSMGVFFGMPYLVNSMDPEMRAEWEERQNSSPMNSLMGSASGQQSANFDVAAFLAGSSKKDDGNGNNNGGFRKKADKGHDAQSR